MSELVKRVAASWLRTATAGPYGIDVLQFDLVEGAASDEQTYPYHILAGEFKFRLPSGKVLHVRGRSDSQNQGFSVDVDGVSFDVTPESAPDGMIYVADLDPGFEPGDLTVDDLIAEVAGLA